MAKSVLVCTTSKNVCTATICSASDKKFFNKPTGQKSSSSRNRVTGINSVEGFRKSFQMESISSNPVKYISHSTRKSSTTNSELAGISELVGVMKDKLILFKHIINFLSEKFDKGLQYRTLNCLRSAISAHHVYMLRLWESIEKFVLYWQVCFIKDLRNLYIRFIWDVEIVLQYIRTHWYQNLSLNNADLTCKLTTLLA